MASFAELPVLEVNLDNFRQMWPALLNAVRKATFVALDCVGIITSVETFLSILFVLILQFQELSGLGERKQLFAKDMSVRYEGFRTTAQTRAIISLGLSCFQCQPMKQPRNEDNKVTPKSIPFLIQTFNILVLCSENYTVEPLSLKFLLEHGFDFNKQYSKGLPYYRGADQDTDTEGQSLRKLFTEIVKSRVPIVLHNAPVDLVFLYNSFYGTLPRTIEMFLADLSEILSGGVYDTKYIAEYKARFTASYLEYVFRKSQRQNSQHENANMPYARLLFPPYPKDAPHIAWMPCGLDRSYKGQKSKPCKNFAAHGWCIKRDECPFSHDIDIILDREEEIGAKKRNKRKKHKKNASQDTTDSPMQDVSADGYSSDEQSDHMETVTMETKDNTVSESPVFQMGGHRAGFDAFMTGLAFAFFIAKYGTFDDIRESQPLLELGMEEFANKVALSGKDIPLQISKSVFAKNSREHREKIKNLGLFNQNTFIKDS